MARKTKQQYNRKKLILTLLGIFLVCLTAIAEINIFYYGFSFKPQKSDVIIVLGCAVYGDEPSLSLEARLKKAYELYKEGFAKKIIVSGGRGFGEYTTEASVMKKYLVKLGVPAKSIFMEGNSSNTKENLKLSKVIMKKHNFKTALIVSNYFHLYRASMLAHDLDISATFARAPMPKSAVVYIFSNPREILSLVKYYLLASFDRIIPSTFSVIVKIF